MPQNKPMSAEAFANKWLDDDPKETRYAETKDLIERLNERDSQLIRSTLEAAAERARHFLDALGPEEEWNVDDLYGAILAPLNEKE